MLRPRGTLARVLYEKAINDEEINQFNKDEWYMVCEELLPSSLKDTFLELGIDEETEDFISQSIEKSSWILTQVWHCLLKTLLSVFMTQTSINGFLRRGSMFVFSLPQFCRLTSWNLLSSKWENKKIKLLDLGAGDGAVTSVISSLFNEVFVTEVSTTMKWILAERGFRILDLDSWSKEENKFEVITCLNLLDRCDRPYDLLNDIKKVLRPDGIVVVAMVLPFKSFVEVGRKDHSPCQTLDIDGRTFESQVEAVVKNVLQPIGYEVIRWTRLPYLCEGDIRQSYYWLDDAVFVLKSSE